MYYTKLIIEDQPDVTLNDLYSLVMDERWKLIADGNGRTKYLRDQPTATWIARTDFDTYSAEESKMHYDSVAPLFFKSSIVYHELVKVWNTESAAQGWVEAVEALNLPGVTITYHGTTDPTV